MPGDLLSSHGGNCRTAHYPGQEAAVARPSEAGTFTGTQRPLITADGDDDRNEELISQAECRQRLLSRQDDDGEADD
jgi:hypothetical protein